MKQEIELTDYLLGEIINPKSNDYLQTYYFTHKCADGNGDTWYKSHTDYTVSQTTALWFKEDEVEWDQQLKYKLILAKSFDFNYYKHMSNKLVCFFIV